MTVLHLILFLTEDKNDVFIDIYVIKSNLASKTDDTCQQINKQQKKKCMSEDGRWLTRLYVKQIDDAENKVMAISSFHLMSVVAVLYR